VRRNRRARVPLPLSRHRALQRVIDRIIHERASAQARAQRAEPAKAVGRPRADKEKGSNRTFTARGETADYLTARIARDRPDILERMRRGEYASVRAAIATDVLPMLEAEAKERQGNRQDWLHIRQKIDGCRGRSDEQAAELFNVNRQYISDAKRVKQSAPELFDAVRAGDKTLTDAKRKLKEHEREAKRQENRERVATTPPVVAIARA
jgi:hypothetical protein